MGSIRKRSAKTGVGVRLQSEQIGAIDAWAAMQVPPVTRPEAIRHDRRDAAHASEKPGRDAGQESEDLMKQSTLSKITAAGALAKGMAQGALAASPNSQWIVRNAVNRRLDRTSGKLDRSEAIRRPVEIGLKAKK